jgi:hypothetical protein
LEGINGGDCSVRLAAVPSFLVCFAATVNPGSADGFGGAGFVQFTVQAAQAPAQACNFYLSTTGSDSNPGTTPTTAFLTPGKLQTALQTLGTAAGTGCLEGGTYSLASALSLSSANDANKTWINYAGQTPILDGGGTVTQGIVIGESGITIQGITVQNFFTIEIKVGGLASAISHTTLNGVATLNATDTSTPGGGGSFTQTYCILMQDSNNSAIENSSCTNSAGHGISYQTTHDTVGNVSATNNTITNTCTGSGSTDCGAMYWGTGGPTPPGFVVSGNTINTWGVALSSGSHGAPVCLYTDDGMSNVSYSFNKCYGSGTYGFLIHGGSNVTHTNEIFDITQALFVGFQQSISGTMSGDLLQSSIIYSSAAVPTTIWRFQNAGGSPITMTIGSTTAALKNIYFNTTGTFNNAGTTTFSTPSPQMIDPSPIVADPLFVNAAAHNYSFLPGSPAFGIGF